MSGVTRLVAIWHGLVGVVAAQRTWRCILLAALLVVPLAGCGPSSLKSPKYVPADAGIDPYARLRERTEEFYQRGLARERASEWAQALQAYELARQWDPDNRQDVRAKLAHAREMAVALVAASPTAVPTLRTGQQVGAFPTPTTAFPIVGPGTIIPPRATTVPGGVLPVGFRNYHSPSQPFSLDYPSAWRISRTTKQSNGLELHTDQFESPAAGNDYAGLMVMGVPIERGITLDEFYRAMSGAYQIFQDYQELAPKRVGDATAYVVRCRLSIVGQEMMYTVYTLITGKVGWQIIVLTPPNGTGFQATLEAMLASFRYIADGN